MRGGTSCSRNRNEAARQLLSCPFPVRCAPGRSQMDASQPFMPNQDPLLAAIVDSADDAIFALDPDGIIRMWNPGAARMYGYSGEEIIGHSISLLVLSLMMRSTSSRARDGRSGPANASIIMRPCIAPEMVVCSTSP
jgi:PAS domain-containing protein